MNNQLPDYQVLIAIAATLIIVFTLIFSVRPNGQQIGPPMQWKEVPTSNSNSLRI